MAQTTLPKDPPHPSPKDPPIDMQIVAAFCEETGLAKLANFGIARKQAKQLAKADFTLRRFATSFGGSRCSLGLLAASALACASSRRTGSEPPRGQGVLADGRS